MKNMMCILACFVGATILLAGVELIRPMREPDAVMHLRRGGGAGREDHFFRVSSLDFYPTDMHLQ
jgi:hypothetical protein